MLLLRAAIGFVAGAEGIFYVWGLSNLSSGRWLLGSLLIASGVVLAAGFLTPLAALVVGICFLGIALSWFPALPPPWGMHDATIVAFGMIVTAAALALLGPGAFSLDCRLFGRREIVIPPASQPPES